MEGLEYYWIDRRHFDLLGQKVYGNFGLGGGPVLHLLQIQECGR